jgi:hypothetical protein
MFAKGGNQLVLTLVEVDQGYAAVRIEFESVC